MVLTSSLANGVEIAMDDPVDLDAEMRGGVEEVVTSTVKRIETRQQALVLHTLTNWIEPAIF